MEVTSVARWTCPPAASMSAPKARATATKSVIAVAGECSAAIPAACGSTSRIAAPVEPAETGHAVAGGTLLERVEACELGVLDRDDELAALVVRQALLLAVLAQQQPPAGAQLGLEAARRVVDAGVHDAGVVPGLVRGEPVLLLEEDDRGAGMPSRELAPHGQPDDAAADHPEAAHAPSRPCAEHDARLTPRCACSSRSHSDLDMRKRRYGLWGAIAAGAVGIVMGGALALTAGANAASTPTGSSGYTSSEAPGGGDHGGSGGHAGESSLSSSVTAS